MQFLFFKIYSIWSWLNPQVWRRKANCVCVCVGKHVHTVLSTLISHLPNFSAFGKPSHCSAIPGWWGWLHQSQRHLGAVWVLTVNGDIRKEYLFPEFKLPKSNSKNDCIFLVYHLTSITNKWLKNLSCVDLYGNPYFFLKVRNMEKQHWQMSTFRRAGPGWKESRVLVTQALVWRNWGRQDKGALNSAPLRKKLL